MDTANKNNAAADAAQQAILAQIEALKGKLTAENRAKIDAPKRPRSPPPSSSRNVLVAASPSPKKQKLDRTKGQSSSNQPRNNSNNHRNLQAQGIYSSHGTTAHPAKPIATKPFVPDVPVVPRASKAASLAQSIYHTEQTTTRVVPRTTSFAQQPVEPELRDDSLQPPFVTGHQRDDRGAIIENLIRGPYEHDPPLGDPNFDTLEPNSGINLSSRKMPHEDFQEILRGRYYLSPSMLYSTVRIQPSKQGYDVPVDGDFVTVAVVAERGNVQVSYSASKKYDDGRLDGGEDDDGSSSQNKKKSSAKSGSTGSAYSGGKKYVNIKLVDFGQRSGTSSKKTVTGDALLTLLLFEADWVSHEQTAGDGRIRGSAIYKGGSGGAFEEMLPKLKEGVVIAILNPRVLKPYQGKNAQGSDKPHPTANILGITPAGADTIKILGYSKDLGMCGAKKRDGKICGSWCDKRVSEVCEYHMLNAVRSTRSSRPEFSAGTSGMSTGPTNNIGMQHRKAGPSALPSKSFDPSQKWGLLPASGTTRSDGSGGTYVMSGSIIRANDKLHVSDKKRKQEQTKKKNAREEMEKRDEELLKQLLRKDAGTLGAQNVLGARELLKKGKGKEKQEGGADISLHGSEDDVESQEELARKEKIKRSAYHPEMLKRLGFDPTIRPGDTAKARKSSEAGSTAIAPRKKTDFNLGPRPGQKIRSGVIVPDHLKIQPKPPPKPDDMAEAAPGDDSDLEVGSPDSPKEELGGQGFKMDVDHVAQDDSDSDLEIEPPPA